MKEKTKESIKKAIFYRCYSTIVGSIITLILTRSIQISITFICLELPIKVLSYYIFERIWRKKHGK